MCTTGICPSQRELIKGHAGLSRLTAGFPEEPLVSLNARYCAWDAYPVAQVQAWAVAAVQPLIPGTGCLLLCGSVQA